MPDVGVLNLQIQDNSSKAAEGLDRLATALNRVKQAVGGGLKLGPIANQIKKLNDAVAKAIPEQSLANLERFANAIEKLNAAGGIKLRGMKNMADSFNVEGTADKIRQQIENGVEEGFRKVHSRAVEVNEQMDGMSGRMENFNALVQQTAWSAGDMAEQFGRVFQVWNSLRMAGALGSGANAPLLGDGEGSRSTGWQQYNPFGNVNETGWAEWKDGAIEAEYTISDAMDTINQRIGETQGFFLEAGESITQAVTPEPMQEVVETLEDMQAESPVETVAEGFRQVEHEVREVNESLEEQIRLRREALDAANQARLEKNYESYRTLFMEGGPTWRQSVPEMYGVPPEAIEQCATYAEAMNYMANSVRSAIDGVMQSSSNMASGIEDGFRQATSALEAFVMRYHSVARLMSGGPSPLLLGSGGVSSENALSTWVDQSEQWKPDWTHGENYRPDWIYGDGTVSESMPEEEVLPALTADNSQANEAFEETRTIMDAVKEKAAELLSAIKLFGTIQVSDLVVSFQGLKDSVTRLLKPLASLIHQFSRVAKYRMLRAVLKQITEGFKEGVENYYRYSQAIGGSFAPAMDSAATSLLQMKNSIGAAVAPLIQTLIPYLQMAVDWFITLVNYANQFLAMMRGQSTWSRATQKSAKAFDDVKTSAKGAAASIKDLLADWDELNIIQSETGGNGGGGGSTKKMQDYLGMFEEVSKFDKGIKAFTENIEKNFGSVRDLVKEIGVAILAWRIGSAFSGFIGSLASLIAAGAIIDLTFKVSKTMTGTYLDTGDVGWLIGDVLTTMIGAKLTRVVLSKVLGAEAASIAIPLTFAVSAAATITALLQDTDVSALDKESIAASVTAALEGGVAAGYIAHLAGATLGKALLGGTVGAIVTFGVAVGLKAVKDTIDTGEITQETLAADLTAAGAIGGGLALGAAILGGTVGTIVLAGGAGAVATFGLLVGIEALIAKDKPKKVMWGDSELTDEQISKWVNEQMFSVDVNATVTKINTVISDADALRTDITNEMASVTTDLNIIKLGLATQDTYDSLKLSLFGTDGTGGVIGQLKDYAKNQKTVIQTGMTLMPIVDDSGEQSEELTKQYLKDGITGWSEVESYMTKIGGQLSAALKEGSKKGLNGYDDELIATLTEKLTNVQIAVTGAQLTSTATGNLLENIAGLSQKDASSILAQYDAYKKELEEGYNALLKEELSSFSSPEAFYRARGEEGDEAIADYYASRIKELIAQWPERLAAGVKGAEGPGKQIIADALSELLKLSPEDLKNANIFNNQGVKFMLGSLETSIRNSDMKNSPEVTTTFQNWLNEILKASLSDADYQIVSDALASGLMNYTDLFDQEAIDALLNSWQGDNNPYKLALKDAWQQMIEDAMPKDQELPETTFEMPINIDPVLNAQEGSIDVETETEDPLITGKKPWTTSQLTGHAGASSGVRYADNTSGAGGDTAVVVTMDAEQQKGNIQSGVQTGTAQLLQAMQTLINTANAINQKDFTVNITPTTMFGRVAGMATGKFDAVTGRGNG